MTLSNKILGDVDLFNKQRGALDVMSLETQVMFWIGEDLTSQSNVEAVSPVPVDRLIRKLPAQRKKEEPNITDSTIMTFQTFDSATIYRTIRHLATRGFVEVVEALKEDTGQVAHYVMLSNEGISELTRLRNRPKRRS